MKNNNWKENRVVKKIYELRKDYQFRHLFAGTVSTEQELIKIEKNNA